MENVKAYGMEKYLQLSTWKTAENKGKVSDWIGGIPANGKRLVSDYFAQIAFPGVKTYNRVVRLKKVDDGVNGMNVIADVCEFDGHVFLHLKQNKKKFEASGKIFTGNPHVDTDWIPLDNAKQLYQTLDKLV